MLCQKCKKNPATITLTQIVNNEKITLQICKDCAAEIGFHSPLDSMQFPLAELLSGMVQQKFPHKAEEALPTITCRKCGLTFEAFSRQGRFGCGQCYEAFRPRLESIMRKLHGSSLHKGKLPTADESEAHVIQEEERLETELKKAIEAEDFERAADLRDKLRELKESVLTPEDES
jgi:protein arginine kinase activator